MLNKSTLDRKVKELEELRRMEKEIAAKREALEKEIKAEMERRKVEELETASGFLVTYRPYTRWQFDSKAFERDHEDLFTAYRAPSTVRRFSVSVPVFA
jgi:predicted phage-related endonuclease